jgi:hypothetical protein
MSEKEEAKWGMPTGARAKDASCVVIRDKPVEAPKKDGRKAGKLKMSYISPISLVALSRLMTKMGVPKEEGGKGYKPHDWLKTCTITDLIEATERHLTKIKLGVDMDEESQELHATCAMFGTMALVHIMSHKDAKQWDDRGSLGVAKDFPDHVDYLTDVDVTPKVPIKEKTRADKT